MTLPLGLKRKTFDEIKSEIERKLISSLGALNLEAPSVLGTLVAIFTDREARIREQLEAVYNASRPSTAEGYSLDGVCALNGITRSKATYSKAICRFTGTLYTVIPKGSGIKIKNTDRVFTSDEDLTINNERCSAVKMRVRDTGGDSYGFAIDGELIDIVREEGITLEEVASALTALVNELRDDLTAIHAGTTITISSNDVKKEFSCHTYDGTELLECSNNARVTSVEKGSIAAPTRSLTEIHTPVSGWISCDNLQAAKIGNDLESDRRLRRRRELSIKLGGSASLEALRANLFNLKGVTAVTITENTGNDTDKDGLPPHSFKVLITGGDDTDVAKMIWRKKPAGIRAYGDVDVPIEDSEGEIQVLSFSRPTIRFIYVKVIITRTREFAAAASITIAADIINRINDLGVGRSVILKSLYHSVFSQKGIANASILLGSSLEEIEEGADMREEDIEVRNHEVALSDSLKTRIILEDF